MEEQLVTFSGAEFIQDLKTAFKFENEINTFFLFFF